MFTSVLAEIKNNKEKLEARIICKCLMHILPLVQSYKLLPI